MLGRLIAHGRGVLLLAILKAQGRAVASRPIVIGKLPSISGDGDIVLGSKLLFRTLAGGSRLYAGRGAKLKIGDRTAIETGVSIAATVGISIGRHCLIADGVRILDSNFHSIDEGEPIKADPVEIGDNVWIGNGAIILPGISIGSHSVIAAGAVVTKSVPAKSVVGGNPAIVIRAVKASDSFIREP